ncbi:MAG: ATP-binding protein [Comamonadaceae bacterium]|nr:ATP-binding protein [Comamonadaceae bacterium]
MTRAATPIRRRWSWPASLRARLLLGLLAAVACTALAQGWLAYQSALAEADALFDYQMQQTAYALRAGLPPNAQPSGSRVQPQYPNDELIVQVWSNEGLRIFESSLGALLPQRAVLGFTEVQVGASTYRVFSLQTPAQVIQVAHNLAARRTLARQLAWRALLPLAVMAPLLALILWWTVRRQLAPIERVRAQLAQRQAQDLAAVSDAGLPSEVQPLVQELNLLLARVTKAFAAQQHFVADAAHELRSPLAALQLQLTALRRAGDESTREQQLARLEAGLARASHLVAQLLQLARQEAGATSPAQPLQLQELVPLALADAAASAAQQGVELGWEPPGVDLPAVQGQAEALRILLRNLLDNAIRYTPAGGQVVVRLQAEGAQQVLTVADSGPGIAPAERERVLDRFYRASCSSRHTSGSGLGLAIAEAIARQHGSRLQLDADPELGGLRVRVVWGRGLALVPPTGIEPVSSA